MNVAAAVTHLLPLPAGGGVAAPLDTVELQSELDVLADEALRARRQGLSLLAAVRDPRFPALQSFHQGLRDALFLEIPEELEPWARLAANGAGNPPLQHMLVDFARGGDDDRRSALQAALAELLVFEAIRLRLFVTAFRGEEFEVVGGEESDVDAIAYAEVATLLHRPELADPEVRPLTVLLASASVSLARDAQSRAEELRDTGEDTREELRMRARLRAALRELRLPEAVLLENALAALLGEERRELAELQAERPVALDGMTRQAMDQRVSRGRRALAHPRSTWPRRRRPALFDLLQRA
ncbi:hypothetical protein SAMN02745121_07775 [Nannocystis exedens]|uniref:Uncharacterized protein n=1 Tax=Nannocystis exedens TaxID=54 RepID=A0A1I2H9T9_9BACT|nr:hypothetical protein [Nannocystis exedens]PCC75804.1 hypothetical protein NAEX_08917 [Nannocystis exedens]SFF25737.1 hypothetical protein SAMN02745121_07775 [Nannocystis exedens]